VSSGVLAWRTIPELTSIQKERGGKNVKMGVFGCAADCFGSVYLFLAKPEQFDVNKGFDLFRAEHEKYSAVNPR
jgi:hypothetical protein